MFEKRTRKYVLTILLGIILCVTGFMLFTHKGSGDPAVSGNETVDNKLPVCVFDSDGNVKYIIYDDTDKQLFMFDAISDYDLNRTASNAHYIEFENNEHDRILVSNSCPAWCDVYYNGYETTVSDRYKLVERGFTTKGTTENFGFDIWEDQEANVYFAVLPLTDEAEMVITFTSEDNTNIPTFNRLDVVEAYLNTYF